jgi:hypothetical protein
MKQILNIIKWKDVKWMYWYQDRDKQYAVVNCRVHKSQGSIQCVEFLD